jgi:hypothetical protein
MIILKPKQNFHMNLHTWVNSTNTILIHMLSVYPQLWFQDMYQLFKACADHALSNTLLHSSPWNFLKKSCSFGILWLKFFSYSLIFLLLDSVYASLTTFLCLYIVRILFTSSVDSMYQDTALTFVCMAFLMPFPFPLIILQLNDVCIIHHDHFLCGCSNLKYLASNLTFVFQMLPFSLLCFHHNANKDTLHD